MRSREDPLEVLLVEDNEADVDLVREALAESGVPIRLAVAGDGAEALRLLSAAAGHWPDLVLLDLNLPRKSGRETLVDIKRDPELQRLPVVVLSTSDAETDVRNAYELQASCYLTKPIELAQYLALLRAAAEFWFNAVTLPRRRTPERELEE